VFQHWRVTRLQSHTFCCWHGTLAGVARPAKTYGAAAAQLKTPRACSRGGSQAAALMGRHKSIWVMAWRLSSIYKKAHHAGTHASTLSAPACTYLLPLSIASVRLII